jgi:nicotinamidase-related amidase
MYRTLDQSLDRVSLTPHPDPDFYPTWWITRGEHPAPFTPIGSDDVRHGLWKPLIEPDWSVEYVLKLEEQAKKVLMIWPYHTMIGTPGQAITPALYEAIAYHAGARQAQPIFLTKGSIPETEHYSILEPEVKIPGHPLGEINTAFLDMLRAYDLIYIAGQAKSHCVLETVSSIARAFAQEPGFMSRLRLLIDCTSSSPTSIDFDAIANEALAAYARQGMKLVRSTDPIDPA